MNTLILNRESFSLPDDGWYQVAPLGEFPHSAAGVVQVVDAAACAAMANRFVDESKTENFAGACPPSSGSNRVLRGGSWSCDARYCRSAGRNGSGPTNRNSNFGFRVVLCR